MTDDKDQAPDKAAEREGVEDTDLAAYWRKKWHVLMGEYDALAALAPKPTGTEAGRGVGAEALIDAKNALVATRHLLQKYAATADHHWLPNIDKTIARLKAATPTPPTPDSTAQGDGTLVETLAVIAFAQTIDDHYDMREFLKGWSEGDTSEWPEFAVALAEARGNAHPVPADREGGR